MDFSKFKTSDWLKVAGGIVVLIFAFVAWSGDLSTLDGNSVIIELGDERISVCDDRLTADNPDISDIFEALDDFDVNLEFFAEGARFCDGPTMFDHFLTGVIPWILIVAIAVLSFLAAAGIFKLPTSMPVNSILLAGSGLSLLLILIRVIIGPKVGFESFLGDGDAAYDRGVGMFLVLAGAIAVFVGCLNGYKESGGNLNDLKDINKIKQQFARADGGKPPAPATAPGMAPPPPPSGMTPPPPPPPPGGGALPPPSPTG